MWCSVHGYINVLVGIPFLHERKDIIIPYQGKCIVSMDDKSIIIYLTPTLRAILLLVNKEQDKYLVQAS